MKLTKDTQQELNKGRELSDLIESPGWGHVRQIFTDKILDLQSVMNLTSEQGNLVSEILARQMAVKILFDVLKEVESKRDQYETNKVVEEDYVRQN